MAKDKIVVIDDSPIVRKLAELALQEEGYKVYTAEDGEEGLKMAEDIRPAVILVDFIMPRMSGYQFCKAARENELLKDIPIILITGKGEDVGKKFAEKFGVVDYFIKPFKSEMLVEKVNALILSQRERVAEEEPYAAPAPEMPVYSLDTAVQPGEAPAFGETPMAEANVFGAPGQEFAVPEAPETQAFPDLSASEFPELSPEMRDIVGMAELPEEPVALPELAEASTELDFGSLGIEETPTLAASPAAGPSEAVVDFPSLTEEFDLEAMQEARGTSVPPVLERATPAFASAGIAAEAPSTGSIETAIDRTMQRYFTGDLPFLIEKTVEDLLKQHGLVKPTNILFSGTLDGIAAVDLLKLIDRNGLTGVFTVYSPAGSAEVYFDKGIVVHALTSKQGRTLAAGKLSQYRAALGDAGMSAKGTRELVAEAIASVANLTEGSYFFEKAPIPESLLVEAADERPLSLLLDAVRAEEPSRAPRSVVAIKAISDTEAGELGLAPDEKECFKLADGARNADNIAALSGLGSEKTRMLLGRLLRAGVLRQKGGF